MTQTVKWRVMEVPTGRYRSFFKRGWPLAYYNNIEESPAGRIECEDDYRTSNVKTGDHKPLTLFVADHSVSPWQWRKVKGESATLPEAKAKLLRMIEKFPHLKPKNG